MNKETSHCAVDVQIDAQHLTLTLTGSVDETFDFVKLSHLILGSGHKSVLFNTAQVETINSCGVREWYLMLERIKGTVTLGHSVLGQAFADQAIVMSDFLGGKGTVVHALCAPYFCAKCAKSTDFQLKVPALPPNRRLITLPSANCPTCGGKMEFDGFEDETKRIILMHAPTAPQG